MEKNAKNDRKSGNKNVRTNMEKKTQKILLSKVACPPQTPLLSTSHDRPYRPHYRCGS